MKPREPIEYLKDLLDDISFAIEQEDSMANHSDSDLINLKNVIDVLQHLQEENRLLKDAIYKAKDAVANDVFAVLSRSPK